MNIRALKKRLMRTRTSTRAYMTISLPTEVVGTPPPAIMDVLPEGFVSAGWAGHWENPATDESIRIQEMCTGSVDPRTRTDWKEWERPLCVEQAPQGYWTCWLGYWCKPLPPDEKGAIIYRQEPIPDEWVERHVTESKWHHSLLCRNVHPVFDEFVRAYNCAKNINVDVFGARVLVSYVVKWRSFKLDFCKAIRHAMKVAKKQGVDVRVFRRG